MRDTGIPPPHPPLYFNGHLLASKVMAVKKKTKIAKWCEVIVKLYKYFEWNEAVKF